MTSRPAIKSRVEVRVATPTDVHAILAIDAQVYPRPWSKKLLLDDIDRVNRHHVVAVGDDDVVGHASLMIVGPEGTISTVATDPAWQRRGVARSLMLALCTHAIETGLEALTLEVRAGSRGAHALYHEFGFAPVGIRSQYYEPDGEDALIMWANDIQEASYAARMDRVATRQRAQDPQ